MLLTPDLQVLFNQPLRTWDGFGFNYVEASQTRDYATSPQDYGGFSRLSEDQRQEILALVSGPDGLRPGLLKMFLDPFHQPRPVNLEQPLKLSDYDHTTTTHWMRYFARQAKARTTSWGGSLQVIVSLYGPPAWMTLQRILRGRDLDPLHARAAARYMISWARYLREAEDLDVRYISLHNEGEDWERWPADGSGPGADSHDYNLYWPPRQVVDFLRLMPAELADAGIPQVTVTPGECTNWYRFDAWGYAGAIAADPAALNNLGLITSHGFYAAGNHRWYGDWRSAGIDTLREQRPELHAWVTSTSWSKMDVEFLNEIRNNIYAAKVNAIIPWAGVQLEGKWVGGDPNPGCAVKVLQDGGYRVERGYHYYKQVCRAGQPGMQVTRTRSNDTQLGLIAFASADSAHPDAFVLLNLRDEPMTVDIAVHGSPARAFQAFCTSDDGLCYAPLEDLPVVQGRVTCTAPARSATTFYALR
jgi:O-glycosyl hydrolase